MKTQRTSQNRPSSGHLSRCLFSTSDGRRCTMLRHDSHPSLCPFHARQERQLLDSPAVAAELASLSGDFSTATDLSRVLAKLFHLLAEDRLSRPKAATLAYITQLLLHNQHSVRHEFQQTHGFSAWQETLRRSLAPALPRTAVGDNNRSLAPAQLRAASRRLCRGAGDSLAPALSGSRSVPPAPSES